MEVATVLDLKFEELRDIAAGLVWGVGILVFAPFAVLTIAELLTLLAAHEEEAVCLRPAAKHFDLRPNAFDIVLELV